MVRIWLSRFWTVLALQRWSKRHITNIHLYSWKGFHPVTGLRWTPVQKGGQNMFRAVRTDTACSLCRVSVFVSVFLSVFFLYFRSTGCPEYVQGSKDGHCMQPLQSVRSQFVLHHSCLTPMWFPRELEHSKSESQRSQLNPVVTVSLCKVSVLYMLGCFIIHVSKAIHQNGLNCQKCKLCSGTF